MDAGPGGVAAALEAARGFAGAAGLAEDDVQRLAIIVEEWVMNIVEHGKPAADGWIGFSLAAYEGGVRLTFSDAGVAFDPRSLDFTGPNETRGGGAGIALILAWSRIADYRRMDGRNHLTLELPLG